MPCYPTWKTRAWTLTMLVMLASYIPASGAFDLYNMDDTITDLTQYENMNPNSIWHPLLPSDTSASHEAIRISRVTTGQVEGNYQQWQHTPWGASFIIVGMTPSTITFFDTEMEQKASIVNEGISDYKSMVVFTTWNERESNSEVYCVVGSENSLTAYKYNNDSVSTLGSWPLHYQLQSLSICQSEYNSKVRLTVQPKDDHAPIDIYNFDAYQERNQLWFSQRLTLPTRNCMSVLMTESYCSILIADDAKIIAYTLDEISGLFDPSNFVSKIHFTCKQQISFTLDSIPYVAAIPSTSLPDLEYSVVRFFSKPGSQSNFKQSQEIFASEIAYAPMGDLRDQVIILAKTETLRMYTYDPMIKSFVIGYIGSNDTFDDVENIAAGEGVSINGDIYYFFPASSQSKHCLFIRIHTLMEPYPSPVYQHMRDVYAEFLELSNEFHDWRQTLQNIHQAFGESLLMDGNNLIINGNWELLHLETDSVRVDQANATLEDMSKFNVEFLNIPLNGRDFQTPDFLIEDQLAKYKEEVNKIKEGASRTIPLDSSEVYVIREPQKFKSPVRVDHLRSYRLYTDYIQTEKPEELFSDLILYPHGEDSTLTIPCSEIVLPQTFYAENVNTVTIGGNSTYLFAYTNDNNHFKSPVEFTQKFTAHNDMYLHSLNGKHFPEDILLASNLDGVVFLDGVEATLRADVEELFILDRRVDGNFSDLILRKDIDQEITCATSFSNINLRGENEVDKLNGDSFVEYVESLIFRTHEGIVSGTKTTDGPLCSAHNLSILKTLNGLSFPEDYVRTGHHNTTIHGGPKIFQNADALVMTVDGTVDGTRTEKWVRKYSKEIRSLSATWDIHGPVKFNKDVHVSQTIGGANVSDIEFHDIFHESDKTKYEYQPNFDILFLFNVTVEGADIKRRINGDTLNQFFNRYVTCKTGHVLEIPGTTTFENGITFQELVSNEGAINNRNLTDLFHRNKDQVLPNHVTFNKPSKFKEIHASNKVDGVNLEDIKRKAVYMREGLSFPSNFTFSKIHFEYETFIASPICGNEDFGENVAVTQGKEYQDFECDLYVQDLELEALIVENLETEKINDFNWAPWLHRRISLSSGETFNNTCAFQGHVNFSAGLQVSTINNYPIEYYQFSMFRSDNKIQKFLSNVDFANVLTENLKTISTFNEYNWTEVVRNAIHLKSEDVQVITGHWHLEHPVFHNLNIDGHVCDSNLTYLHSDGVHKDNKRPILGGDNKFTGSVQIEYVTANTINKEMEYFKKYLAIHGDQDVRSPITWKNGVDIASSSSSNTTVIIGKINGVPPGVLDAFKHEEDGIYVIATDMEFDEPITTEILHVARQVQHVDIEDYQNDLIPIDSSSTRPINLQRFVFLDQTVFADGVQCDRYNSIDLVPFVASFLTISSNVTFNYPVSFTGVVTAESFILEQGDLIIPSNTIQGISLEELVKNSIPLNSKNTIEMKRLEFAQHLSSNDDVDISHVKSVNGIPFQDLLTLEDSHRVDFLHVGVLTLNQEQLNISGDFGGFNIREYYNKSVLTNSTVDIIRGHKSFINMIKTEDVTTGEHASIHHLVYMDDAVLHSPVEFRDPVQTDNMILKGDWNKVNLEKLDDYAAHTDRMEDIGGKWTFHGGLVLGNESYVHGFIDGENVSASVQFHENKTQIAQKELGKHYSSYDQVCTAMQSIYLSLSTSPLKLQSVDIQQVIPVPHPAESLLTVQPGDSTYLLASSGCGAQVFKFSKDTELFEYAGEVLAKHNIHKWEQISNGAEESYIVFSSLPSSCSRNSSSGLYLGVMNPHGNLTNVKLLFSDIPLFFKVVENPEDSDASLFVVFEDEPENLKLVAINLEDLSFETKANFEMDNAIKAVDLISNRRSFMQVVVLVEDRVSFLYYNKKTGGFKIKSQVFFYGSSKVFKSFEVNNDNYVVVSTQNKLSRNSVKPSISLQLFRATTGELEFVQSIESYNIKSCDRMYLDSQVFLACLLHPSGLHIYKFMGMSGLVLMEKNPIQVYHGESLHVFHYQPWHYHTRLPFILASCKHVIRLYHSNVVGNSEANPESSIQLNRLCNSSTS